MVPKIRRADEVITRLWLYRGYPMKQQQDPNEKDCHDQQIREGAEKRFA